MEFNRNHFMVLGLVILALGIQFRRVEAFVLNEKATAFIAKRLQTDSVEQQVTTALVPSLTTSPPPQKRTVKPPRWLGWAMLSIGAVLVLHSLAMPKPG